MWKALDGVKRTATGPDAIPYWVWRDQAEILTGVVTKLWNLFISSHSWRKSWKRADINPSPRLMCLKETATTAVSVYRRLLQGCSKRLLITSTLSFEDSLAPSQFAYRDGGCVHT